MFKVGDKVEIIDTGERYTNYTEWVEMYSPEYLEEYIGNDFIYKGDEGVILVVAEHKSGFPLYLVQLEDAVCLVNERAIILTTKDEGSHLQMNISELKSGNIVVTRKGLRYIVILDCGVVGGDVLVGRVNEIFLEEFGEGLHHAEDAGFDIMKVYSHEMWQTLEDLVEIGGFNTDDYTLLWEREEVSRAEAMEIRLDAIQKELDGAKRILDEITYDIGRNKY